MEWHREGDPTIWMKLDISSRNVRTAYLEILLGVAVIVELSIFVALLQRNTARILIAPLERIFGTIKKNASTIVQALETNDDQARPVFTKHRNLRFRPRNRPTSTLSKLRSAK